MKPLRSNCGKVALLALCAATAATTTGAQAVAATSNLPIYPGATALATQLKRTFSTCGHEIRLVSYKSAADGKTVAKWYESKIPGAVVVDLSKTDSGSVDTEIEVFTPNTSEAAVIHQMSMTSSTLQAAAKSIGADKTGIGLETFDPPLGADYLSLVKRARHGDAAAKSALTARCPKD